jgi:proton glutamate symport protein
MKNNVRLLIALSLALCLGIITSISKNETLLTISKWIEPVGTIWIGFLRMTILPLVIALLINSITGMSKTKNLGPLIKKTFIVFLSINLLMIVVTLLVVPPLLKFIPAAVTVPLSMKNDAGANSNEPLSILKVLLSWIPLNPFQAAAEGAIIPLIIFSILLGLALNHVVGKPKKVIVLFFRGISEAMLVIVKSLFLVAPVGIFAVVLPLVSQLGTGLVGALAYYLLIFIINVLACMLMLYVTAFIFSGIPFRTFSNASLQPQLIVIGTQSSVATLPAMVAAAEHDLKIPPQISGPVLTLAVSVFRAGSMGALMIYALFTAHLYQIDFSFSQMTTLVVISFLANIASIGLPSAASFFAPVTTLFQAIGLPFEMIAVLFAVDTIPDVTQGVANVTGDMTAVAIVANFSKDAP